LCGATRVTRSCKLNPHLMKPCERTVLRLCGISLLVLAVSPVTAPFSTCDLMDLLGSRVPHGTVMLEPKNAPDDPVVGVAANPRAQAFPAARASKVVRPAGPAQRRDTRSIPLRI
jgi:hypothetical protein